MSSRTLSFVSKTVLLFNTSILIGWFTPCSARTNEGILMPVHNAGKGYYWGNVNSNGPKVSCFEITEAGHGLTAVNGMSEMRFSFMSLTQQTACTLQQQRPPSSISAYSHINLHPSDMHRNLFQPFKMTGLLFAGIALFLILIVDEFNKAKNDCPQPAGDQPDQSQQNMLSPLIRKPASQFVPQTVYGQNDLLSELINVATDAGYPPPKMPDETISAVSTNKGHFRIDNQDFHLTLQLGKVTALFVADGCGGLPHGAYAAYMAVREAASFLVRQGCGQTPRDIVPMAREALFAAATGLEQLASKATPPIVEGFRTTLIVIIADNTRYAFAYGGDGGGIVIRKSGDIEKFLFPQKHPDMSNVLITSLGPTLEGEPASGAIPRYPGDLLLTGSDGVWDYADEVFPHAVAQYVAKAQGNLPAACGRAVNDLADFTYNGCHLCPDNLTLGIIATPLTPAAVNIKELS